MVQLIGAVGEVAIVPGAEEFRFARGVDGVLERALRFRQVGGRPDGDVAENRVFKVVPNANEPVSEYRIYIYDRAGRCVFESINITEGWNGTYKGQKLPQAAYVYVLSCKKSDGSPYMTKGSVVLVR